MTWSARIGKGSSQGEPWRSEVLNGAGNVVARILGSADYVCKLTSAMCDRESIDVRDLLAKPKPLLHVIHGEGRGG